MCIILVKVSLSLSPLRFLSLQFFGADDFFDTGDIPRAGEFINAIHSLQIDNKDNYTQFAWMMTYDSGEWMDMNLMKQLQTLQA